MKQKSLLVSVLMALLALILFALVGCEPVKYRNAHHTRYHQPRTYVQPRLIIVQQRQPSQPTIRHRGGL
jgi:hypothetical protein